jgi:hypothetical protein
MQRLDWRRSPLTVLHRACYASYFDGGALESIYVALLLFRGETLAGIEFFEREDIEARPGGRARS